MKYSFGRYLSVCFAVFAAIAALSIGTSAALEPAPATLQAAELEAAEHAPKAPIALLVDVQSGQTLLAENPDRRFIPASITKVMSAFVAFELLEAGKIKPNQEFAFNDSAAQEWYRTGSTMFLEPGEKVSVDSLLKGITAVSANDASIVLAEGAAGSVDAWTAMMNATARKLGMHNSYFATPNGWPDNGRTFTTARDLEILAKAMIARHPQQYAAYFGKAGYRHNGYSQANHDPIIGVVDGADGIKTGFTNQAGHGFLGSAKRGGTRLILVLGGVDTEADRAAMARQIMEWGFTGFDRRQLYSKGAEVASAKVQDGAQSNVRLLASDAINVVTPTNYTGEITLNLIYKGPLKAPIIKGEKVAELEIVVDGLPPARVPLMAQEAVTQASAFRRVVNALQSWVG